MTRSGGAFTIFVLILLSGATGYLAAQQRNAGVRSTVLAIADHCQTNNATERIAKRARRISRAPVGMASQKRPWRSPVSSQNFA